MGRTGGRLAGLPVWGVLGRGGRGMLAARMLAEGRGLGGGCRRLDHKVGEVRRR